MIGSCIQPCVPMFWQLLQVCLLCLAGIMVLVLFAFELLQDYVLLLLWLAGRQDWRQKLLVSFASASLSIPITEHIDFNPVFDLDCQQTSHRGCACNAVARASMHENINRIINLRSVNTLCSMVSVPVEPTYQYKLDKATQQVLHSVYSWLGSVTSGSQKLVSGSTCLCCSISGSTRLT